jgi:hypothetical protein
MTEQTATPESTPATVLPESIDNALGALRENPAYSSVVPMLSEKLGSHYALIRKNNRNVARINEAKETDPESAEYQDSTWKRVVAESADPEMVKLDARRQKLIAEEQKILMQLREKARNHMEPALSDDEVQRLRKEVNDGKSVISASVTANAAIAEMADQMLTLAGKPVENGIWSLMPQPDSLMNTRGKGKSKSSESGEGYATRLVEAFINGKTTNRNVKRKGKDVFAAHFNYVAEALSKEFGDKEFPGNIVTAEEVERAYYGSKGVEWRASDEMPADHTFEFTKEIEMRNGADNSVKKMPVTKSIRVVRWTKETAGKEGELAKPEGENTADNAAENASNEGTTNDTTMAGNVPNQA